MAAKILTVGALTLSLLSMPALAQTAPPAGETQGAAPPAAAAPAATAATQPAVTTQPNGAAASGGYYVEFRVGQIGTYGHSYAVYGPVKGRPNYADLHPMGGYAVMALGHVLPVPGNTEWNPEVLTLPVASRYRRSLNAAQYQKLVAKVRALRAQAKYWNAISYNCNHFIGEMAEAVGLKVPNSFQLSYEFVPALRALNEGDKPARARKPAPTATRPAQTPPS